MTKMRRESPLFILSEGEPPTLDRGIPFHTFSQLISIHANEGAFFPPIPYDSVGRIPRTGCIFMSNLTIVDPVVPWIGRRIPHMPL